MSKIKNYDLHNLEIIIAILFTLNMLNQKKKNRENSRQTMPRNFFLKKQTSKQEKKNPVSVE